MTPITDRNPQPTDNTFQIACLRPKPESLPVFVPLWDQRNVATLLKDKSVADAFEAVRRGDTLAYSAHMSKVEELTLQEEAISREMRQHQDTAWVTTMPNLITNVGHADMNDKYWRGAAYTQTVVMGLKGAGAAAAGDTQASHAAWLEVGGANAPAFTGNRKAVTMGAATVATPAVSVSPQQTFAITSGGTVAGMFMNNGGSATKDDTTGVLACATDFSGGNQVVANLDSLLVTYTFNG